MDKFIRELIKVQDTLDLYDGEMAERIGCTRQWYLAIRQGKAKPSMKFMKQVKKAFPGMSQYVREVIDAMLK